MHLQIVTRFFLPIKAGVETHCYEVAKRVGKMGHEATVLTRDDGFNKGDRLPPEEIIDGFKVHRSSSNRALTKLLDFNEPIYLNNFDMSLTFSLYTRALLSWFHGKRPKIWLVPHGGFTPYWGMFSLPRRSVKGIYHLTLGRYFINNLTCGVSALNVWEKDQLIKAGVDEKLITIKTNGVEDIAFDLPPQRLEDNGLAWLSGRKYILMLCRVSREKNIDRMIEAISNQQDVHLIIGGSIQDQSYYDELNALTSRTGMADRVHFVGYVSEGKKYALIDGALALALISLYECDPITVKESLARGIPIITSNIGPLPSIVLDGMNGFLADQENVTSISSAIAKAMTLSPKDRSKMEVENKSKAIDYRWESVTASLIRDIELCEGMKNG
ncbi:MAG: glycosyltransferase family 4 protein [Methanomassiliicoccus sp.]|nr:glycosyltransferase family 4 protein [Methanomassiliicoccus sp.]